MPRLRTRPIPFPELSYANAAQAPIKRWVIRSIEGVSGRDKYAALYGIWKTEIVPSGHRIFGRMLDLIGVRVLHSEAWPPTIEPCVPLVIVANHPFGIGDGIAVLSLAEQLGRPFRVMINSELLKVPEIEPYSLPIDFSESKEALKNNLQVRHEALRLLREGVTIVIFPAGGVATAPKGFGKAQDLPWKMFAARLVQDARASVIPLYFSGQCGRLFHLVSRHMDLTADKRPLPRMIGNISLTLRTSLLIREFARLSGGTIDVRIGRVVPWDEMEPIRERKALLNFLKNAVFSMAPVVAERRRGARRFPLRPGNRRPANC
ncbi:lysophospholipid acyltransferase family protein [Aquibium oceanicum]|uniref:Glycerol acyltransferase n=1 Tax=Aquibium oceanicum TaxID=1670800 RepID=A0A1L3SYX4_9HYPH|nr:lysophospholipid acyltransferase family protein [Aquibium oceanicum]APH74616.1 glycerol acyltransferase [Aquibium oceanicum]